MRQTEPTLQYTAHVSEQTAMDDSANLHADFPRRRIEIFLFLLTLAVYLPVIFTGGFIWDDPQYITQNPLLRTFPGLWAIWAHPSASPQYYPLVHTMFWLEYHLWGLWPAGYHLDNVLLHAVSVVLLFRILRLLKIPGSFFAALIFAIHPVHVESVAWATERKNVLSAVFYLLAMQSYLKWDVAIQIESRLDQPPSSADASQFTSFSNIIHSMRRRAYLLSLVLFVAALLSKSVTCSLPAAILLIFYFKRGKLLQRDIIPLIPFFIIGVAMAAATSLLESSHVGAAGPEWNFTFLDRCLIAGRALWFYAAKLFWPHPLTFIYPQWPAMHLASQPWLAVFPITALLVAALLWFFRDRLGRGPIVAVLFFAGTLLPALGFINLYPMRYSFVADHFQYLASIGLIVPFSALACRAVMRVWPAGNSARISFRVIMGAVALPLIALTIRQQLIYRDALALWSDTYAKNPAAWMVWNNLADTYKDLSEEPGISADQQNTDRAKAREFYRKMLDNAPELWESHWKWGTVLEFDGDLDGALRQFQTALQIQPQSSYVINSIGAVLMQQKQPSQAMDYFLRGLNIDPLDDDLNRDYAIALESAGRNREALPFYMQAVATKPDDAIAQFNLGNLLMTGFARSDLALEHYAAAANANPRKLEYHYNFAVALYRNNQPDAAKAQCRAALEIDPNFAPAKQLLNSLGSF